MKTHLIDMFGSGMQIDLLPLATQALDECPVQSEVTEHQLAELVDRFYGQRPPKNVLPPVPDSVIEWLVRRVESRCFSIYRLSQIQDPDIRKMRPFIDFDAGDFLCAEAAELTGRFHSADSLVTLPLQGCPYIYCRCRYRTLSHRSLARMNRLDKDGQPIPAPSCGPRRKSFG